MTRDERAREVLNQHCEYMDGLNRGQVHIGVKAALAAMLAFADAEAAAMRERAAGVASEIQGQMEDAMRQRGISSDALVAVVSMVQVADAIATAIRNLPATGEG